MSGQNRLILSDVQGKDASESMLSKNLLNANEVADKRQKGNEKKED